jgi:signal transduction histidine kinase
VRLEYVQGVNRLLSFGRRHWLDLLIVLGALGGALEVALRDDPQRAPETTRWFAAPAVALIVLPLLGRRRFPFAAPAAVWVLGTAIAFVDGRLIASTPSIFVAGMISAFLLGNLRDAVLARLGLVVVLAGAATIVYQDPEHTSASFVFTPLFFGLGWLAGFALRERASQAEAAEERAAVAEREREAAARVAVAEERSRIARELHDVVAHAVSVMTLQVGAVRHKLPEALAEDKDALRGVERTGRTALTEMRRLLGALHEGDGELAPQPGLADLDALAAKVGRAGLPVEVRVEGDPSPLPRAIDLSAYRIVQEGLTNALKHARAGRADVTVRYGTDGLELEVRDDGAGTTRSDGLGHGLVGIRERVKIYGGEMTAGPAPEGGFVLRARLPLEGSPR